MSKVKNRVKGYFSSNGSKPKLTVKQRQNEDFLATIRRLHALNTFISRGELMSGLYGDCFHNVDERCGYPSEIEFSDYKRMYERDGVASRVVSVYPSECWSVQPFVYEREDLETGKETAFEKKWKELVKRNNLLNKLYRLDEISGIGRYGVMLIGVSGSADLSSPAYKTDRFGYPRDLNPPERDLLYLMPFDEGEAKIESFEENPRRGRYGKPSMYNISFVNPKLKGGRTIASQELVHWTRCVHVADGCLSNDVLGTPRMQKVWNYLLNLRKIYGGSGEMFWNGGFPGTAFQVPPELAGQVELDKEALSREIEEYYLGLKRYLALVGVEANQLKPNIATPIPHVEVELEAVCISIQIPLRVFKGTEEARLASMQDTGNWHGKVRLRLNNHCTPNILYPTVDRFMAMGVMPYVKEYHCSYPDLEATSEKDKADIASKLVRAISEYMKSGAMKLIPPLEFLTMMLNFTAAEAEQIIEAAQKAAKSKKYKYLEPTEGELKMAGKHPSQVKGDTRTSRPDKRPAMGKTRKVKGDY